MRKITKSALALATSALAVASIAAPAALAWGDNSANGRRSYTIDQINHGVLGDKIVFNSISDGVDGDEKNFVDAQAATDDRNGTWQGNNISVEDGKEYVIRLYAHNNSPKGTKAIAKDTKVAISIPEYSAKKVEVNGFIQSSNATPSKYWDYVNFVNENNAFHLEYVYGSAVFYNNGIGKAADGYKLGDDVVTKATSGGQLIGYDKLDGNIPGCFQYDSYVTIKVKAVFDTQYLVEKKVRLEGTTEWKKTVEAKVGDRVEYQIQYKNISTNEDHENVMIKDILPNNMRYVPGTTKLYNSIHNGATLTPDGDIVTRGVNIGNYKPGINAYIRFTAEVVDKNLACGSNTLVNWAQAGVGQKTIQDHAEVHLTNGTCDEVADYGVRIDYVYEDGTTAETSYTGRYQEGDEFTVVSPSIAGYKADHDSIHSVMGKADQYFKVVYSKIQMDYPVTPEPVIPDPVTPPVLPSTGATGIAGALIASGSSITALGCYLLSKKEM